MIRKYFVYWSHRNASIDGNIVIDWDFEKGSLEDLIEAMIKSLQDDPKGKNIDSLVIEFITEIKP